MRRDIAALTLVLALALVGCGSATHTTGPTGTSGTPTPEAHAAKNRNSPPPPGGESRFLPARDVTPVRDAVAARGPRTTGGSRPAAVNVARTPYGRALVDARGFALYLFTRDRGRASSTCNATCAAAWPPYIVRGHRLVAGAGAVTRRLGTTRRHDGRLQLTYNGRPLYYYIGDRRPRQVLCQAVTEFGGTWYVVDPKGQAITRTS